MGAAEAAVAQWKKTLRINSRDRDAIYNLAKAYNDIAWEAFMFGKRKEAILYWKKALKINPGNKASKYYLKIYGS